VTFHADEPAAVHRLRLAARRRHRRRRAAGPAARHVRGARQKQIPRAV